MEAQQAAATKTAGEKATCCSAPRSETRDEHPLVQLQRTGNRALGVLIQAKLNISQPGDEHEQEAARVADQVMRMPEPGAETIHVKGLSPQVQRKCDGCAEDEILRQASEEAKEDEEPIQRKAVDGHAPEINPGLESGLGNAFGGGQPLSASARSFFEPRFGHDFAHVRVHTDAGANAAAHSFKAHAFTFGRNVVFGARQYAPETSAGRELLAHELSHVVQQQGNHPPSIQRRTYRDTFTTVAYLPGPLWNVHLTITHAPDADTERLDDFINACHDGVMNAARSLGERPAVSTREIRVRIRFNARLDESAISQRAFELAMASLPRPAPAVAEATTREARPRAVHIPDDPSEDHRSGETDDQRIRRQASATLRLMSNTVADAGIEGYSRVVFTIHNNGREISFGLSKEGQTSPPPRDHTSAFSVRDHMGVYFDQFVAGSGRWQMIFTRQGNAMSFSRFERIPEAPPPMSEEDELRALGIPNRREIYAQIFAETQRQVIEAGVMIAGFTIEQIVLWVAGGVLLRGLALLGRGTIAAFPRIMALVSRGSSAGLAPGLGALSVAERREFAVLMQRVESGVLSGAEQGQLRSMLTRIEGALPSTLTRSVPNAAQLMSRIRIPRVTSVTGSRGALDAELLRRAAEIRATQAGLSLEAFTNYNVAVARVRTASGEIVYLEAGNMPAALHSEEYILAQLRTRASGLGPGARVEQLYSERIPCSNCSEVVRRFFGEGTPVYYTVGNQPNRGRLLMEAYGL